MITRKRSAVFTELSALPQNDDEEESNTRVTGRTLGSCGDSSLQQVEVVKRHHDHGMADLS